MDGQPQTPTLLHCLHCDSERGFRIKFAKGTLSFVGIVTLATINVSAYVTCLKCRRRWKQSPLDPKATPQLLYCPKCGSASDFRILKTHEKPTYVNGLPFGDVKAPLKVTCSRCKHQWHQYPLYQRQLTIAFSATSSPQA